MTHKAMLLAAAVLVAALPLTARAETRLDVARRASEVCYQAPVAQKDVDRLTNSTQASRSVEARISAKPCVHNDALTFRQRS